MLLLRRVPMRCSFVTFGCKINQYDTQAIREAVEKVKEILDCERASVFLSDPGRNELFTRMISDDGTQQEIRIPWDKGIAGACYQSGNLLIINDPYNDPRFNQEVTLRS